MVEINCAMTGWVHENNYLINYYLVLKVSIFNLSFGGAHSYL